MPDHIQYTYLETGIHRFKWLDRSKSGSQEFYELITSIYRNMPSESGVIRILHDYRDMPIVASSEVERKLRELQYDYPHLNRRIAYLSDDILAEALIVPLLIMTNRTGKRQFFKSHEEDLAIRWLLDGG